MSTCSKPTKGFKLLKWTRDATKEQEAAMFQELMRGLEEQYLEMATIFTSFSSRGAIFRDIQVRSTDDESSGEMFIDVQDSKILLFGVMATGAVYWRHLTDEHADSPMSWQWRETLELTNDTMACTFMVEIQVGPMQCNFRGKQCVRRYEEEQRVVIVWNMLAEPLNMGGLLLR